MCMGELCLALNPSSSTYIVPTFLAVPTALNGQPPTACREMSVAEYFSSTNRKLHCPGLPCVNVGGGSKPVYYPLEMCQ